MSVVYVEVPQELSKTLKNFAKTEIYPKDVLEYEEDLHVTLLHGLHTNDVEVVKDAICEFIPIRVMFGKTSMFMADSYRPSDVVKIDVFGMSLKRLRGVLETLPFYTQYKIFTPHVTLAYVEPYTAIQYIGNNPVIGTKFVSDYVVFKSGIGKYKIYCDGKIEEINDT